jgi:ABC-type oligopeptide transport system substrate-binding subunit
VLGTSVTLDHPASYFLSALSFTLTGVVEQGTPGGDISPNAPIHGSGPFMVASLSPNSSLSLVPNPGYVGAARIELSKINLNPAPSFGGVVTVRTSVVYYRQQ